MTKKSCGCVRCFQELFFLTFFSLRDESKCRIVLIQEPGAEFMNIQFLDIIFSVLRLEDFLNQREGVWFSIRFFSFLLYNVQ
jgi:hypothetical protein